MQHLQGMYFETGCFYGTDSSTTEDGIRYSVSALQLPNGTTKWTVRQLLWLFKISKMSGNEKTQVRGLRLQLTLYKRSKSPTRRVPSERSPSDKRKKYSVLSFNQATIS